jgi:hypothetical protein
VTDALRFQNVHLRLVKGKPTRPSDTSQHHEQFVEAGDLSGIADVKML